ncbi:MAG: ABC transporter permease [Cytophagales bacterium]|nr:ABC transporter permease [Bernardetiaceae bacterium]MDW8203502.1 ABC transporter permease [Cytophagales bacterium]
MLKYILWRFFSGFWVILGVIVVVFLIFHVLPGNPVDSLLGRDKSQATRLRIMREYRFDRPIYEQLILYLNDLSPISLHRRTEKNLEKFDYTTLVSVGEDRMLVLKLPYFGHSISRGRRVSDILLEDIEGTFWLAFSAMLFASTVGIGMGMVAALNQGTRIDTAVLGISVLGISTPSFITAILVQLLFAYYWADWTGLELQGSLVIKTEYGREYQFKNLILPALTLGLRPMAIIMQLTRNSLLEVMSQDYIRTARAKGVPKHLIIFKHALKNALNPVITAVTGWLASLMAGAFFVEFIFKYRGLGFDTMQAVSDKDFPIVMGATIVVASFFVLINILVDIVYAYLDPRIKLK